MQRLRTLHPDKDYTSVPNQAMDDLPDLESLGLLAHILRHRDDWHFRLEDLVEQKPGLGRRAASKARATLIGYGFLAAVKLRHNYRGQYATELWRSAERMTDEDLSEIAGRYMQGAETQIPILDGKKKPRRDTHNRVMLRQVTVTWAQVESFRGVGLVTFDGLLMPKTPHDGVDQQDGDS